MVGWKSVAELECAYLTIQEVCKKYVGFGFGPKDLILKNITLPI
jgi:hypothetical protein